ncbi:MAG: shikimate dehydrogenase [Polyangiaceae bacterium]
MPPSRGDIPVSFPRRFVLVGNPVRRSASPAMHRAAYRALGLPHVYDAIECRDAGALNAVVKALRSRSIAGMNITTPYKRDVLQFVDDVHSSVDETGAANTLVLSPAERLVAYNTDLPALVSELRALRPNIATAVILGAGGAAAAAVAACKSIGVRVIAITTRSWSSSEAVFESAAATHLRNKGALTLIWPTAQSSASSNLSSAMHLQWAELAASADLIIQATSAGMMNGDPGHEIAASVPWARLNKSAVAIDLVYGPTDTPFLAAARSHGLRAVNGVGMLVRQGALSFELWLRQKPPLDVMMDAVTGYLQT